MGSYTAVVSRAFHTETAYVMKVNAETSADAWSLIEQSLAEGEEIEIIVADEYDNHVHVGKDTTLQEWADKYTSSV